MSYCDPSQFQTAIEEAFLADQGFAEKLIADIYKAAGNTGCSNSILKGFQKVTDSNQNAAGHILKQVCQLHAIFFIWGICMAVNVAMHHI